MFIYSNYTKDIYKIRFSSSSVSFVSSLFDIWIMINLKLEICLVKTLDRKSVIIWFIRLKLCSHSDKLHGINFVQFTNGVMLLGVRELPLVYVYSKGVYNFYFVELEPYHFFTWPLISFQDLYVWQEWVIFYLSGWGTIRWCKCWFMTNFGRKLSSI